MSVATEFPPVVHIPERARPRTATVLVFPARTPQRVFPARTPRARETGAPTLRAAASAVALQYPVRPLRSSAVIGPARSARIGSRARSAGALAPVRLTRRGYVALGVLVAGLAAGLLWFAHASATAVAPTRNGPVPAVVTVQPGDTLWSIANRIASQRDPRAVVHELEQRNGLSSPVVYPGQRLRTR